ncbi:MAG: hypothetical protein J6F30_04795 [Cellulosilyticum sp.]|nr:hypothetical protein [Cellulosilyticum sp.]
MIYGILICGFCIIIGGFYFRKELARLRLRQQKLVNQNLELHERESKYIEKWNCILNTYEKLAILLVDSESREIWTSLFDYMEQVLGIKQALLVEHIDQEVNILYERNINEQEREHIYELYHVDLVYEDTKLGNSEVQSDFKPISIVHQNGYRATIFIKYQTPIEELEFVKKLCAIILEQIKGTQMSQNLLINQEQNRIANEIHDSVLQQLFGINCHLYTLSKKVEQLSKEELVQQLDEDRKVVKDVMTELRQTIYGMSWYKQGKDYFLTKLESYIHHMETLYEAQVYFEIEGAVELLGIKEKMGIYRIICEGLANSLRHGKAERVHIRLEIDSKKLTLEIKDQGIGFEYKEIEEHQLGLGIKNIQKLALVMGGDLKIQSAIGKGTGILIDIPIAS